MTTCDFCDSKSIGMYDRVRYCNQHWFDAQMAKG